MRILKKIIGWICLALILLLIIYFASYRFRFPELTETQLLLKLWYKGLLLIPLSFGLHWGLLTDNTTTE